MITTFRSSKVWVLDFTYDGRSRRWFTALPEGTAAAPWFAGKLLDLYGRRTQLVSVRPATTEEELQYVRGTLPRNLLCPTGGGPLREPDPPPQ
jgi:hypothetical protein